MKNIILALLMSILTLNVFAQNDTITWSQYDGVPYPFPANDWELAEIVASQGYPTTCEPNIVINIGSYTPVVTIIEYFDSLKTQWRSVATYYFIPFDAPPVVYCVEYLPNNNSCQIYNNPENMICGTLAYNNNMYCSIEDPLGVHELQINKKLVRVIDETGRDSEPLPNRLLIYIYDDGTKEKKVIIN